MCLNGNFDTFCFDFTNVTKVTVRKYFSPPMRSQVLMCTDQLPRGEFGEGLWLWGDEVFVPNPVALSGGNCSCMGQSGRQGTLQLPTLHLWGSQHHPWDLFLFAHTDKKQR